MKRFLGVYLNEPLLVLSILTLIGASTLILRSIAPSIFPSYYLYLFGALLFFIVFSHIDFDILSLFSTHLYVLSIIFLLLPLVIGEVTRGAARWIQVGSITLQPTEIIRPFIILFFAQYLSKRKMNAKEVVFASILFALPVGLIIVQPSLGVSVLTSIAVMGVVLSLEYNKRILLGAATVGILALPLAWFLLAPYQKDRIIGLVSPASDPSGVGYNSIQSVIAVGSGRISGRGLGEGVQTQLSFLPERHSDFIFASISEEMGLVGAVVIVGIMLVVLYRLIVIVENSRSPAARAFVAGSFLSLFAQVFIHIGMNIGILPITGLPLPLVSVGGSSLVATMILMGIILQAKRL